MGTALVKELLASPNCTHVIALLRRETGVFGMLPGAGKLEQRVINMDDIESEAARAATGCKVAFCTLGVGQPSKVSKQELWAVDVEYSAAFARGCKTAGVGHISLLTSSDANLRSRTYYLRVKGSAEYQMRQQKFARTSFFRPSLLVTQDIRYGLQDQVTQWVFPKISPLLPSRWHEIKVEDLGRAMRINAERPAGNEAIEILHYDDFLRLLDRNA